MFSAASNSSADPFGQLKGVFRALHGTKVLPSGLFDPSEELCEERCSVHHCDYPTMIDLRARALENAAACDAAGNRAINSVDRLTFHMLRELWSTLAHERDNLTDAQVSAEFHDLLDIQQDVAGHLRPTLH
jgi:hypothetical protein